MTTTIAPLTGFAGIPCTILSDEGRLADWHRELVVNEEKVPSSNETITQVDGFAPWTLECRVLFASVADWQRFDALRGTRGALRHLAAISAATPPAAYRQHVGEAYVSWQGVLYKRLVEPPRRLRDGRVIARVVFQREGV